MRSIFEHVEAEIQFARCIRKLDVICFNGSLIELVIANRTNLHKLQGLGFIQKVILPEPRRHKYMPFANPRAGIFRCKCLKMLNPSPTSCKTIGELIGAVGEVDVEGGRLWKIGHARLSDSSNVAGTLHAYSKCGL